MWLNRLFAEESIDFEKRCRLRIRVGLGIAALGLLAAAIAGFKGSYAPFYGSMGVGLMAGGLLSAKRNRGYLKNPALRKEREVVENDERNRLLGLRCWAYTGYTMFLLLYMGILVGGFINPAAATVLLVVTGIYGLLLLLFRLILARAM